MASSTAGPTSGYDSTQNVASNFKSSSADVQRSVAGRIERERAALMASSTAGPLSGYDSKMADVKPDKTLPPKEVASAPQDNDPTKRSDDIIAQMAEHMENQTRALRDINDNTKKTAQHAVA